MLKIAYIIVIISILFSQIALSKKRVGVEELESILKDIDNTQSIKDLSKSKQNYNNEKVVANPCNNHICGWGKECAIIKGYPVCQCISSCPTTSTDQFDQVCANNNQTYDSLCELYRQRCVCKKRSGFESECNHPSNSKIHLEYLGSCKKLDECTNDLMVQFPERMSDWLFQVMKELKKRRELNNLEWEELVSQAESSDAKKHVYPIIWKFCDLDVKPHDKHISHHELIPITAPVIPMESCIKPFLESCDSDKDGSITIIEWGMCLGLKDGEIQERC